MSFIPWWGKYPNVNNEILNLDWILSEIARLKIEVSNFINLNTIKYADPIQWNITRQYEKNTVVVDPITGTAYLSSKPVPSGVSLENTDYWSVIFTLDIVSANKNITLRDDGNNILSTFESSIGDWLMWQGVLYEVTRHIGMNTAYVVGYNIERKTVESFMRDYFTELLNTVNLLIGDLADLSTTDKSNVVAAINEVYDLINNSIGDLSDLTTTDKTNVVAAINEVLSNVGDNSDDIADLNIKVNNFGWINVKDHGVKGDGVTDDTSAIQDVFTNYPDHTIYFPTGVYLIKNTLTGTDINLIGDGQQTSILLFKNNDVTDLNGIIINQLDEENFSDCVTVHDLSICCDSVGTTALNVKGDFLGDRWQISPIIFNVYIGQYKASAFTTGWKNGIIIENCNGASIHDCSIKGCINTAEPSYRGGWGIKIESNNEPHGTDFMLNNNMISLFEIGIRLNVFEGVSLSNSRIVGVNYGIYNTSSLPYPLLIISGTHINASKECVHATTIKEFISTGSDYYCQLGTDTNVWGLKLTDVTYSNINGNSFNNLTGSNMFGIELGGTSNKNNISGNIFHNQGNGTMTYSMSFGSSTSNNLISGNIIDGHPINDSGTANTKVNNI